MTAKPKPPDAGALETRRAELERRRAELLGRLGEAVAAGRAKEQTALRRELDDVDASLRELDREAAIARAAERAVRDRERDAALRPLVAAQAELRERWAEAGARLQAAADALEAAWAEHEACWYQNQQIAREMERVAREYGGPAPAPLSMHDVYAGVIRIRLLGALKQAAGAVSWDRRTPADWPKWTAPLPRRDPMLTNDPRQLEALFGNGKKDRRWLPRWLEARRAWAAQEGA